MVVGSCRVLSWVIKKTIEKKNMYSLVLEYQHLPEPNLPNKGNYTSTMVRIWEMLQGGPAVQFRMLYKKPMGNIIELNQLRY